METIPIHKMPLCDCANHGATCRGRQDGKACMAHDKWFRMPCDEGRCPGPFHNDCCHRPSPEAWIDE